MKIFTYDSNCKECTQNADMYGDMEYYNEISKETITELRELLRECDICLKCERIEDCPFHARDCVERMKYMSTEIQKALEDSDDQ